MGSYEVKDLNNYIKLIMVNNDHYDAVNKKSYISIIANKSTLKSG